MSDRLALTLIVGSLFIVPTIVVALTILTHGWFLVWFGIFVILVMMWAVGMGVYNDRKRNARRKRTLS